VVVLIAVVGGLILLTRDSDDTVELTESQREDALLTDGDIGEGFAEQTDDDADDASEPEASDTCLATLDELEQEANSPFGADSEPPPGAVERHFEEEGTAASIDHGIAPTIDIVELYERFAADCPELSVSDDPTMADLVVDEGDAPDVGDEAIALDITISFDADGDAFELEGALVAWTRDGQDSFVTYFAGVDPDTFEPVPLDRGLLEDIVTRADEKLEEVIDEA
jgi:hypothetical protein